MDYEYEFYEPGTREDATTVFTTDEPLPHIQIGHSVFLESYAYSTILGHRLKIADVEVLVIVGDKGDLRKVKTMVYFLEEERTPEL